ncbi:hypothetical protein AB0H81_40145, partial [Nonomuraea sp. NPDC050691]
RPGHPGTRRAWRAHRAHERHLTGTVSGARPGTSRTTAAEGRLVLATVSLDLGGDAAAHLAGARELLESLGRPMFGSDRQAARCWRELGDLYGRAGGRAQQTAAYRKALEAAGVHSALAGLPVDAAVSG